MATLNSSSLFIVFLYAVVFGSLGCECLGGPLHAFNESVSFSPGQLQHHIGDTIWMTDKFSCRNLLNTETGKTEDYCGIEKVSLSSQIFLLEPWSQDSLLPSPSTSNFDFINEQGNVVVVNDRVLNMFFQSNNDDYCLKIGIIPKKVGQYFLSVNGGGSYQLPNSKKCDTASFGFTPQNQDTHISLLETFKGGAQNVTEFERSQCYCFEVIQ